MVTNLAEERVRRILLKVLEMLLEAAAIAECDSRLDNLAFDIYDLAEEVRRVSGLQRSAQSRIPF